jgi:hypothetical protein
LTQSNYGTGITEHDIVRLKDQPIPKTDDPVMELARVWHERCKQLRLVSLWWPTQRQMLRWLDTYGLEICKEAVKRGIAGYSRVVTLDKGPGKLAVTQEDAIHQMNYIQKTMKSLKEEGYAQAAR